MCVCWGGGSKGGVALCLRKLECWTVKTGRCAWLLLVPAGQPATSNNGGEAGGGLLRLDEPTNHLDTAAINWLASFLGECGFGPGVVLVAHDQALLKGACKCITKVRRKRLH